MLRREGGSEGVSVLNVRLSEKVEELGAGACDATASGSSRAAFESRGRGVLAIVKACLRGCRMS
jgi:hypothetical protein